MTDGRFTPEESTAPVSDVNLEPDEDADDEEMPQVPMTRRYMLLFGFFVISAIAFLYFGLPQIAGLSDTWDRINRGDPYWLAIAALCECLSFGGYIVLFRTVFVRGESRIDWRESYEITMAGLVATRLFAAAGAGGIALTAWAVRRSGLPRRIVACRMVAFMSLLYVVFMGAMVVFGLGLRTGLFHGGGSFAITVIPAILGASAIVVFLAIALLPSDFERLVERWTGGHRRLKLAHWAQRLASVPASLASGVRTAIDLVRARHWGLLGALAWWAFDIAVLWACFHAFGSETPPIAVIVMGYYVGQIANVLPLPGGIGGVEGGMIGAFIAFDVSGGLAVVAVLAYRAFAFWLPTIPGVIAYIQLRRTVARWKEDRTRTPASVTPSGGTIQSKV
jgi:putative heme transporter